MKLKERNIVYYLKKQDLFSDVNWKNVNVKEIRENTNVNFVYMVDFGGQKQGIVYIKQAFPFVKVAPDFPAPIERQKYEKESIEYLQRFWKGRIPKVVHYDEKNNILIVTDVGENAKLLATEIKEGRLHFEIGKDLGLMMAKLHALTYAKYNYPVRDKKANDIHISFIFDFRLRGSREVFPKETEKLFLESLRSKTSIIYGDWASKNVFVYKNKIKIVDFENLVRFDPAYDIGYALAHWVLDLSKENKDGMVKFFKDFEDSYKSVWKGVSSKEVDMILKRSTRYIGGMMLHRLVGVKNTNRMEEYLSRDVDLIKIGGILLKEHNKIPSEALKEIGL